MIYDEIIKELTNNVTVFKQLFAENVDIDCEWKQNEKKWCLLEIACHMHDVEIEDFRARTKHVLETPNQVMLSIEPDTWATNRKYMGQNYRDRVNGFLAEREKSILWFKTLVNPQWDNVYEHPIFGKMSAKLFLANWLAHDYLHIRQITKLKYDFFKQQTDVDFIYSGTW